MKLEKIRKCYEIEKWGKAFKKIKINQIENEKKIKKLNKKRNKEN